MILLLCHLTGDYVLQSHVMATRKTTSSAWAIIHAAFYSIPFAVLLAATASDWTAAVIALFVICGTHALIDRYALAAKWCRWYGVGHPGVWDRGLRASDWSTPPFDPPPPFLGVWLQIIVDNTMHLAINAAAVYLATGVLP